jgi:hypothetical protein
MNVDFVSVRNMTVHRATAKALLCICGGARVWIPRSQIHQNCALRRPGDSGELILSAWLADRLSLEIGDDPGERGPVAPVTLAQTTRIYRRLASEFHPDRNPDGAPTMRAINSLVDAVRWDFGAKNGRAD